MKRFSRRALQGFSVFWAMVVWVLLWGNISLANIITGLAVGLFIVLALPLPQVPVLGTINPIAFLRLLGYMVYQMAISSAQVAWLAVRPQSLPPTGVLRHKFSINSDLVLTLCVDAINLIPGTMVVELDGLQRIGYIHVLDLGSANAIRRFHRSMNRIEELIVASFEGGSAKRKKARP
jgi:multicomponent Na+:H+ antiporter subunit E